MLYMYSLSNSICMAKSNNHGLILFWFVMDKVECMGAMVSLFISMYRTN